MIATTTGSSFKGRYRIVKGSGPSGAWGGVIVLAAVIAWMVVEFVIKPQP